MNRPRYQIINADILEWAAGYDGPKFHALFCDSPYYLSSITKRFGSPNAAPAKPGKDGAFSRASAGFMNQRWDSDIAFKPETWAAMLQHLHPGAFGMTYGGSRTYHRIACAIEDAGAIIHPNIFNYVTGMGFPKATRIPDERFSGHRYGLQATKPAVEPLIVFQRPYEGKPVDCITATGAGALNVDGGRITTDENLGRVNPCHYDNSAVMTTQTSGLRKPYTSKDTTGRWPSNFTLTHSPECQRVGVKRVKGSYLDHECKGSDFFSGLDTAHKNGYTDPDGYETVEDWQCVEGCPARMLGEQSGESVSRPHLGGQLTGPNSHPGWKRPSHKDNYLSVAPYNDSGTAARFFFQAHWSYEVYEQINNANPVYYTTKTSRAEREAGLDHLPVKTRRRVNSGGLENEPRFAPTEVRNDHPTVKNISLNKYFSTLLAPPEAYAPRRILVPFAGVASEMLGALLSCQWEEIVGIELMPEYAAIGEARLAWWADRMRFGATDPEIILDSLKEQNNPDQLTFF